MIGYTFDHNEGVKCVTCSECIWTCFAALSYPTGCPRCHGDFQFQPKPPPTNLDLELSL